MTGSVRLRLELLSTGGNNAGFEIPDEEVAALGAGGRPTVVVTAGKHTWRTSIARMGGRYLLGVSAANRAAAGIAAGDVVDLVVAVDDLPREVEVPDDLATALEADPAAAAAWSGLSYTLRKEHARSLIEAKRPETRARRLDKVLASLR